MEKNKQVLLGFSYIYLAFKTTETSKNIEIGTNNSLPKEFHKS